MIMMTEKFEDRRENLIKCEYGNSIVITLPKQIVKKGLISDSEGNKSVYLTDKGTKKAKELRVIK